MAASRTGVRLGLGRRRRGEQLPPFDQRPQGGTAVRKRISVSIAKVPIQGKRSAASVSSSAKITLAFVKSDGGDEMLFDQVVWSLRP